MFYVDDDTASALITPELAFNCVSAAFRDLSEGIASINPVVIGKGCEPGETGKQQITAVGDVLRGAQIGRTSSDDITVFDSSGVAIQDLYVAAEIVRRAKSAS